MDTAGGNKYKYLSGIYINGAHATIFVYDITKQKSFDDFENSWKKLIKDNASKDQCKL